MIGGQDIVAWVAVAVAAVYVGWRMWRRLRGSASCGCGKGGCSAGESNSVKFREVIRLNKPGDAPRS